jgi:predicted small lipoprotein YifL
MIETFPTSMRILYLILACLLLSACGTKGPLSLPQKPAPVATPPTHPDHGKDEPGTAR